MKSLLEISKLVVPRRLRKMDVFLPGDLSDSESKFNRFFQGMMEGRFKNDRDASMFLYQALPSDDRYRKLKSRFRKRLLNTLFLLNRESMFETEYERAYYQCNQEWTLIQLLQANEANHTASKLASHILQQAQEFRFADIVVRCARLLQDRAAAAGDVGQFGTYEEMVRSYGEILSAENEADSLMSRLTLLLSQEVSVGGDEHAACRTVCDQLLALSERIHSPGIFYNMYRAWALRYELEGDYDSVIKICDHATDYIREHRKFYPSGRNQEFVLLRMRACLHLLDFRMGQESASQSLMLFQSGQSTWFRFMELYFLLCMHTQNFVHALAVYHNVRSNKALSQQEPERRDKWRLFQAYLYYMLERKDLRDLKSHVGMKSFKAEQLSLESLDFSREKRFVSLHILLLRVLFHLHHREFGKARLQILELKEYGDRYLKKENQMRFLTFVRLLYQYQKSGFLREETRSLERYLDLLKIRGPVHPDRNSTLEVLRFQDIWAAKLFN